MLWAKKKEDENFKFRRYLKGHADEKELDKQFARLHKELRSAGTVMEFIGYVGYGYYMPGSF